MATTPWTFGMSRRHHEADARSLAHADDDGPLDPVDVEHVDRVGDQLIVVVRRSMHRSIAAPIAWWVERQHRVAAGEPGNLRLPHLGVDDRVSVEEQDGRPAGTEPLPVHVHTVRAR